LQAEGDTARQERTPLAHLLHALNQPLTGLQCSLELAVASPRSAEQYINTLREGLELTGRMCILVEAVRELADLQPCEPSSEGAEVEGVEPLLLDALVRDTVSVLIPLAEGTRVKIRLADLAPLPVRAHRKRVVTLLFRFLDSALGLALADSELRIEAKPLRDQASLVASWEPGPPPEHSPFSRPELGLLIAQAGWESAGAEWIQAQQDLRQVCTVLLPLDSSAWLSGRAGLR
jgi:signal transduction histidine kinase